VRSAETGMAGDVGGRVELSIIRTTDVSLLVTICQDRMGEVGEPQLQCRAHPLQKPQRAGAPVRSKAAPVKSKTFGNRTVGYPPLRTLMNREEKQQTAAGFLREIDLLYGWLSSKPAQMDRRYFRRGLRKIDL